MKILVLVIIISCLLTSSLYCLDAENKDRLIDVYNLTADLYALIVQTADDLENKKIDKNTAENKILEWKERYESSSQPTPREAEKMCALMNKAINISRDLARDYEPNNLKTKDLIKELGEVKSELKQAMNELKYLIR